MSPRQRAAVPTAARSLTFRHVTMKRTLSSVVLTTSVLLLGAAALPGRTAPTPHGTDILVMGTDGRDTISAAEQREFHMRRRRL